MTSDRPIVLAPRSVDRVRLIRRSMRCFVFGAVGLIPIVAIGLAMQALNLHRAVCLELGESSRLPSLFPYLFAGLVGLWFIDPRLGFGGDIAFCLILVAAESWHLVRHFNAKRQMAWNPGRRALLGGVVFAYAGLNASGWAVAGVIYRLLKSVPPV